MNNFISFIKTILGYREEDKIITALIEKIKSELPIVYYQDVREQTNTDHSRIRRYECAYEFSILELDILVYYKNINSSAKRAGLSSSNTHCSIIIDNVEIVCRSKISNKLVSTLNKLNKRKLIKKDFNVPSYSASLIDVIRLHKIEKDDMVDIIKKDIYFILSS